MTNQPKSPFLSFYGAVLILLGIGLLNGVMSRSSGGCLCAVPQKEARAVILQTLTEMKSSFFEDEAVIAKLMKQGKFESFRSEFVSFQNEVWERYSHYVDRLPLDKMITMGIWLLAAIVSLLTGGGLILRRKWAKYAVILALAMWGMVYVAGFWFISFIVGIAQFMMEKGNEFNVMIDPSWDNLFPHTPWQIYRLFYLSPNFLAIHVAFLSLLLGGIYCVHLLYKCNMTISK